MVENYRFSFCVWDKKLDYWLPECGDEWGKFETDEQALLAAETSIEGKLARGARKVRCIIEVMKGKFEPERFVKTIHRPSAEFRRKPTSDPNATRVYPVHSPKKS